MYVETVVGPDTVNTMPPPTLDALLDHGKIVADTVETDLDEARATSCARCKMRRSRSSTSPHNLQVEGVTLFSDSFAALLGAIVYKQKLLESGGSGTRAAGARRLAAAFERRSNELASADFLKRIWAHDATLWSNDPDRSPRSSRSRSGWLDIQQHMLEAGSRAAQRSANEIKEQLRFRRRAAAWAAVRSRPDILADTFGQYDGLPAAATCSTRPVRSRSRNSKNKIDIPHTLFIISSKSGTTTEPNAFYAYFHEKVSKRSGATIAGRQLHRNHRSRIDARQRGARTRFPRRL